MLCTSRLTPLSPHYYLLTFVQRYLPTGKQFRLGIMAPVPRSFIDICERLQISIPTEHREGGVYVDGKLNQDDVLKKIQGKWRL